MSTNIDGHKNRCLTVKRVLVIPAEQEDLGRKRFRDKQTGKKEKTFPARPSQPVVQSQPGTASQAELWEDKVSCAVICLGVELPGESVGLGILGARSVGQSDMESVEEEGQSGQLGVQSFGCVEVFKIFMVSKNQKIDVQPPLANVSSL